MTYKSWDDEKKTTIAISFNVTSSSQANVETDSFLPDDPANQIASTSKPDEKSASAKSRLALLICHQIYNLFLIQKYRCNLAN